MEAIKNKEETSDSDVEIYEDFSDEDMERFFSDHETESTTEKQPLDLAKIHKIQKIFLNFTLPQLIYYVEFINSAHLATSVLGHEYNTIMKLMVNDIELNFYDVVLESTQADLEALYQLIDKQAEFAMKRIRRFKALLQFQRACMSTLNFRIDVQENYLHEKEEKVKIFYQKIAKNTLTMKNRNEPSRIFTPEYMNVEPDMDFYQKLVSIVEKSFAIEINKPA